MHTRGSSSCLFPAVSLNVPTFGLEAAVIFASDSLFVVLPGEQKVSGSNKFRDTLAGALTRTHTIMEKNRSSYWSVSSNILCVRVFEPNLKEFVAVCTLRELKLTLLWTAVLLWSLFLPPGYHLGRLSDQFLQKIVLGLGGKILRLFFCHVNSKIKQKSINGPILYKNHFTCVF